MIFDIKMDGKFTCKNRFVAGKHMVESPSIITQLTVVTRESLRIIFILAGLYGLDVMAADVSKSYLNVSYKEFFDRSWY